MFTDMVGYSAMMQKDEQAAGRLRDRHREAFIRNTEASGGEILQYYGDGTLSIYPSALSAVECAIGIQGELRKEPVVPLRIGIHTGDITYGDEDVFGDGVNIAARIERLCVPGGVFISEKVYDDIKNHPVIKARSIGPFKLKNIMKEIEIYTITNEGIVAPPLGEFKKISPFSRRPSAPSPPPTPTPKPELVVTGGKNKVIAGILGLFFGPFGAHRFYLGQHRLGMWYLGASIIGMFVIKGLSFLVPIVGIVAFIDAMILFFMPKQDFDRKYNTAVQETLTVETRKFEEPKPKKKTQPKAPPQKSDAEKRFEKLWEKALGVYKEFDYGEAIAALKKAAEIKPNDPEVQFLLACCYSVNEDTEKSLTHLDKAVAFGLKNKERIQSHNDLAFLRMQPQFDVFANNGYRIVKELPEPTEDLLQSKKTETPDLLEQLQELKKMREEGQLTEIEYIAMKRKLSS